MRIFSLPLLFNIVFVNDGLVFALCVLVFSEELLLSKLAVGLANEYSFRMESKSSLLDAVVCPDRMSVLALLGSGLARGGDISDSTPALVVALLTLASLLLAVCSGRLELGVYGKLGVDLIPLDLASLIGDMRRALVPSALSPELESAVEVLVDAATMGCAGVAPRTLESGSAAGGASREARFMLVEGGR